MNGNVTAIWLWVAGAVFAVISGLLGAVVWLLSAAASDHKKQDEKLHADILREMELNHRENELTHSRSEQRIKALEEWVHKASGNLREVMVKVEDLRRSVK